MQSDPSVSRFFSSFRGDVQNNISTFCRMLWESDHDVYIFMARKAACFFDSLRELGVADVRGFAVNDRVLDMDLSFLEDKKVLLVDDCIFTGTTLYSARNAAINAGCKTYGTHALAVNIDAIRQELLPGGGEWEDLQIIDPVFRMTDSDCVRQCHDIVRAISILPRPYDVDFPHSKTVKIKDTIFENILKTPGWQVIECSSEYQRRNNVFAFSVIPHSWVIKEFWNSHGVDIIENNFAKIRIYARYNDKSRFHSVRFVPIIMLPAMANEEVQRTLSEFVGSESALTRAGFITPRSRYRFLHFLTAHSLLNFYENKIKKILPEQLDIRKDLAQMSFGTSFWNLYLTASQDLTRARIPQGDMQSTLSCNATLPKRSKKTTSELDIASNILDKFHKMYVDRELSAREYVRNHGLKYASEHPFYHSRRLLEGVTPGSLCSHLASTKFDIQTAVSVFLDRIIDLGVAVPIIEDNADYCCRAFRHGEDALLGEAEERLILQALQSYNKKIDSDFIRGLELQKVIVLIIQIATRRHFLSSIKLNTSIPSFVKIVSSVGYLHGPVPVISQPKHPMINARRPYIDDSEDRSHWLTNYWVKKNYLEKTNDSHGKKYKIINIPRLSLGEDTDAKARQVGRCLGTAAAVGAINSSEDLIMLSTCTEPDHMLRALSGEIAIFKNNWPELRQHLTLLCRDSKFSDAYRDLRIKYNVFAAINSGAMKYEWYLPQNEDDNRSKIEKLIFRVKRKLIDANEDAMADEWIQLWPSAYPITSDRASYVWKYINKCGQWIVSLNVALRLIDYWLRFMAIKNKLVREKVISKSQGDIIKWISKAVGLFAENERPEFVQKCSKIIEDISDRDERKLYEWSSVGGSLAMSFARQIAPSLLDDVTAICSAYGDIKGRTLFTYALYFNFSGHERKLTRLIDESIYYFNVNDYLFLPDNMNPYSVGRWLLISGGRNSTIAVQICAYIAKKLSEERQFLKVLCLGQLAKRDSIVKFSHSTHISSNSFLDRLWQLDPHLNLQQESGNTLYFVNELSGSGNSECKKFAQIFDGEVSYDEKQINLCVDPDGSDDVSSQIIFTIGKVTHMMKPPAEPLVSTELVVLLCTATSKEDDAIDEYAKKLGLENKSQRIGKCVYRSLGRVGNANVYWARSGMGTTGSDGSALTTLDAIEDIKPKYVISCGLAFGATDEEQNIGDVLISSWVRCYEPGRQGHDQFIPRGDRITASPTLLQAARVWRIDRKDELNIHEGGFLSGDKLVDDENFKKQLFAIEPEAIGGDMEGAGILSACSRRGIHWIVVKSICDWGKGKTNIHQSKSAMNAVDFVISMLMENILPD